MVEVTILARSSRPFEGEAGSIPLLLAQPAVEALDEGILHWLAGRDVVPVDPLDGPAQHRHAGQFSAIVRGEAVMVGDWNS